MFINFRIWRNEVCECVGSKKCTTAPYWLISAVAQYFIEINCFEHIKIKFNLFRVHLSARQSATGSPRFYCFVREQYGSRAHTHIFINRFRSPVQCTPHISHKYISAAWTQPPAKLVSFAAVRCANKQLNFRHFQTLVLSTRSSINRSMFFSVAPRSWLHSSSDTISGNIIIELDIDPAMLWPQSFVRRSRHRPFTHYCLC